MNIKYKFDSYEQKSDPLTPIDLFKDKDINGGLYPMNLTGYTPNQIFGKNIDLINQRISKITKQLTYWDLYKLVSQVQSPTDLDSTFASLIAGQALVINCASFVNNNQSYHRGDVVIKMLDGEAAYIPAIATGVFTPQSIYYCVNSTPQLYCFYWDGTKNNTSVTLYASDGTTILTKNYYISNYKYFNWEEMTEALSGNNRYKITSSTTFRLVNSSDDIDPNANLLYNFKTSTPTADEQTETLRLYSTDITDSFVYGIFDILSNVNYYEFNCYRYQKGTKNEKIIKPIIKFFTSSNEEINMDFTAILNTTTDKWRVEWDNTHAIPIHYIQVK